MRRSVKLVLTLVLLALAARVGAYTIPYESWMGAYVGDKKVGYLSFKIEKTDEGYSIFSVMNNHLTILGSELTQLVTTRVFTDKNFAPLREVFEMSSGGKTTTIRATFKLDSIDCVISAGSGSSRQTVAIPKGVVLTGDSLFALPGQAPEIGKEYSLHYFNPLSLSVDSLKVKATKREKIKAEGVEYDTLVVENATALGDMRVWQTDEGDVIRVQAMMGITMTKQDRTTAMSGLEAASSEDFAVRNSIKPDRDIPNPRGIKELDIIITGLREDSMTISDFRQKTARIANQPDSVRIKIKTTGFTDSKSLLLPIAIPKYSSYLASTAYLDSDVAAIKEQAAKIVSGEKNAYKAASKIRAWIYGHMKADSSIGITRSASDVLKSKKGVCRDYGILFAAIARAAGIPSKIAAGVLYTNGGFYYHVWVECFVGEWVPFDATLPTDYVDATHIKMAEGDATSMFGLSRVIGSLKAEIKDFK